MNSRTVLITGAAGGLGAATSRYLAERGWHVFAADLQLPSPEAVLPPNVTPVQMDVTDGASIETALQSIGESAEGLDGVVHMAGILAVGAMIEMPEETLAHLMDVNFMGTFRVNKAFFPLLRKKSGRIINISSETGWQSGAPFNGAYATSKHAIECYSDSLRRELQLLGMDVIKIQPGAFHTEMVTEVGARFEKLSKETELFTPFAKRMQQLAAGETNKSAQPELLAKVICHALACNHPRHRYSVKPDWRRSVLEWFPTPMVDFIFRKVISKGN